MTRPVDQAESRAEGEALPQRIQEPLGRAVGELSPTGFEVRQ